MMTPSKVLSGDAYKIEPGYEECASYLPRLMCGGIGVQSGMAECFDYRSGTPSPANSICRSPSDATYGPYLGDFLAMMDHVDENVRFYCMTDQSRLRRYIDRYLKEYLNYAQAEEVWQIIDSYLARHTCAESGYRANVVIGTPFVNDLYYQTSWKAAQAMFSSDAISSLQSSFRFLDGYNPMVPPQKTFVICFDGGLSLRFYFDVPDGQCHMDNTISQQFTNNFSNTLLIQSKDFHCSESEYNRSFRRYIWFLSNWMLILSCWICMHEFGQFAFGLYWETGIVGLLQRQQHNKWWQIH